MFVEGDIFDDPAALVRIGRFGRLVGVPPETLRAWEDRYGLLRPRRSSGGFRLYCSDDARRVASMKRHLQSGLPASEAARRALATESHRHGGAAGLMGASELGRLRDVLEVALVHFDSAGAHRALDELLATFSLEVVLRDCVVPLVRELDVGRERGERSPAQEQFSSRLLEGRLLAIACGWELGEGPLALIGRGPSARHVIGITAFGLTLRNRGWRIVSLGRAVSPDVLAEVASALSPELVVLSLGEARPSADDRAVLLKLGEHATLAIGGRAATPGLAMALGAELLASDPVAAAAQLAERGHTGRLAASALS